MTKFDFSKKNWILHYKRALKSGFLVTSFFSPVKYRGQNSENIDSLNKVT